MDAQRTSFVLTIAALLTGTALAAPPSESAPVRNDWSSSGPTSIPTISKSPTDRYGNPQYTYPPATQPQSLTQRVQNGVNDTANSLRNGVDTGVRTAGQQFSTAATNASQQTFGTAGYPSQSSNPFATQPAAPPASTSTRNLAPPPWTTGAGTTAPPTTPSWDSSTPVTPVDRSLLTNPAVPQASGNWSSIGSTIAAPPLLTPQLPTTASGLAPLNTTPFDNGPALTTDSYRGAPSSSSTAPNWAQQSSAPTTARSTTINDGFAAAWDASANNNNISGASIGSTANNSARSSSTRESEFPSSPRLGSNSPEVKSTSAKPTDSWAGDSFRNSLDPQNGFGASIGASKTAAIGSGNNFAPGTQAQNNAPPLSPPAIGSAGSNVNFNGTNPNTPQPPMIGNGSKSTQASTPNGEPQPWVTLLAAILGLAGSLAGNVYLGWSYLDARQKYQALVRRTADTFRRTKVAA